MVFVYVHTSNTTILPNDSLLALTVRAFLCLTAHTSHASASSSPFAALKTHLAHYLHSHTLPFPYSYLHILINKEPSHSVNYHKNH
ncbi:hypothetical protein VNO77_41729 [Canavalia gladiata]|uniref:Uncharacterized protein n=1 Tax=Canavalia gladiata TaxID=3824 RepID=A0AAN9PS86_CANGL